MLIAFVGWLVGYDGAFKFDNIGDSYITNKVPYVAYRSLSAILGTLTVPIMFKTLQASGFSLTACVLGASLVAFDNAHVVDSRLILLDATLIISVAASIYSYVMFSKQRDQPFSYAWWKWLLLTGVALSCTISTKYVGLFTFVTIGCAVAADLWNLLDYDSGLTLPTFGKHFAARFFGLIVWPLAIFLFWFWVHFTILTRSGPGDEFMSPEFQETLGDNLLAREAKAVNYYDTITIKNKMLGSLLHSHEAHYPLRYDDGRVSSQGQQVTAYTHPDVNNEWQILPAIDYPEDAREGIPVFGGKKIRLRHVATDTILLTHDVASPYYPTNEEFTTVPWDQASGPRYNDTLFELQLVSGKSDQVRTKAGQFKLVHVPTRVAMWTHSRPLPDWGFGQFEVNGNKNILDPANIWTIDEIIGLSDPERLAYVPKEPKKRSFFKKYLELQITMFAQNNQLTSSHPYASEPIIWPFLIQGVSFWTNDEHRTQIFFHGNFVGWWLEVALLAVFVGVVIADQLTRRRRFYAINDTARNKLYNSIGFFFVGWATHYFPFFLMGRQKFLHHYLPAHLCAALLVGAMYDFVFGEFDDEAVAERRVNPNRRNKTLSIATAITLFSLVLCFFYFAPLTYGYPGLSAEQVQARQWLKFTLHFAK